MRDYKDRTPQGKPRMEKRGHGRRFFGIMAGMVVAFAIFIVGIKVGIQVERERVRLFVLLPLPAPCRSSPL